MQQRAGAEIKDVIHNPEVLGCVGGVVSHIGRAQPALRPHVPAIAGIQEVIVLNQHIFHAMISVFRPVFQGEEDFHRHIVVGKHISGVSDIPLHHIFGLPVGVTGCLRGF